jgi:hypothetical protein
VYNRAGHSYVNATVMAGSPVWVECGNANIPILGSLHMRLIYKLYLNAPQLTLAACLSRSVEIRVSYTAADISRAKKVI